MQECRGEDYCSDAQEPCIDVNRSLLLLRKLIALCRSTVIYGHGSAQELCRDTQDVGKLRGKLANMYRSSVAMNGRQVWLRRSRRTCWNIVAMRTTKKEVGEKEHGEKRGKSEASIKTSLEVLRA